jgi:hypothetical protein
MRQICEPILGDGWHRAPAHACTGNIRANVVWRLARSDRGPCDPLGQFSALQRGVLQQVLYDNGHRPVARTSFADGNRAAGWNTWGLGASNGICSLSWIIPCTAICCCLQANPTLE